MSGRTVDHFAEWLRIEWEVQRQEFGDVLSSRRKELGIRKGKMAKEIGVHHAQIGRWERGEVLPKSLPTLIALKECYNLGPQESEKLHKLALGLGEVALNSNLAE